MRQPVRMPPKLPAAAMQTYQAVAPPGTHFRPATCEEVGCENWANGWVTLVDETTDLGRRQAAYVRADGVPANVPASPAARGQRRYTESRHESGLTAFTFPPGTRCFASGDHRVPLEREPLYLVRGGDWRGDPTGRPTRQHASAEHWVEDFATHQQQLADTHRKG